MTGVEILSAVATTTLRFPAGANGEIVIVIGRLVGVAGPEITADTPPEPVNPTDTTLLRLVPAIVA